MSDKIRILTVNCMHQKGSTGKIIKDTAKILSDECEFVYCYEVGDKPSSLNEYKIAAKYEWYAYYILARLTGLKYCTGYTSTARLINFIKKQKPDIVHLHCPNTNSVNIPKLLSFLKKHNIPTVVTNHAEFYYTGNCPHAYECMKFQSGCGDCDYLFDPYRKYRFDRTAYEWKQMKNAFEGFEKITMVAVSPWVKSRISLSPITDKLNTVVVKNGVDTENVFHHTASDIKQQLGISDEKRVLLHVTASFTDHPSDLKGGRYIIELAKKLSDIDIVVVGPHNLSASAALSNNIHLVGPVSDQELLAAYYSMADTTVISSRRETFGMVCAESLCCGTPVVGFCAGGPDSISLPKYSRFVQHGDVEALADAVSEFIDKKNEITEQLKKDAEQEFSCKTMASGYLNVYKELLKLPE